MQSYRPKAIHWAIVILLFVIITFASNTGKMLITAAIAFSAFAITIAILWDSYDN